MQASRNPLTVACVLVNINNKGTELLTERERKVHPEINKAVISVRSEPS